MQSQIKLMAGDDAELAPSRRLRRRLRPGTLVGTPLGLALTVGVLAPVIAVAANVFGVSGGFWNVITSTLSQGPILHALLNTLALAAAAGVFTTSVATALAWLVYRTNLPLRR